MKNFPFKILFLCVFLPPIFYILTLQGLENLFQSRETSKLNDIIVQNYEALYEGRYTVKDEIHRNLGEYLSGSIKYGLGLSTNILVKTGDDRILYPAQFDENLQNKSSELYNNDTNYLDVAAENYNILNNGLTLSVDIRIRHNSWLSNGILLFYVFLAVFILRRFIIKGIREIEQRESEQMGIIEHLSGQLNRAELRLSEVKDKEEDYLKRVNSLDKEKENLSTDIDALLEEMERLESGLESQRNLREKTELEVLQLKDELEKLEGKVRKPKTKKRKTDLISRRFKVLYKNLIFTERAIEGFISLTDEFQLKAEEVIHRINEDNAMISVKRKVFGKGGKMNVLEVDFSYSGRIYYQKDSQTSTRVIAIGTKKTQDQDLAYLEREKS